MGRYNILVTAISGDVSNSILKCLAKSDIVNNLYGCDIYQYPCGINKVKEFFRVAPCCEEKQYLKQITDICRQKSIDVIVPANEYEINCLNKNREYFHDLNTRLLLHSSGTYEVFFNKYSTQRLLKDLSLPSISSCYADEYEGEMKFPLIIKNVFSSGSKGVQVVENERELAAIQEKGHDRLIQECVGTSENEYTVPVISLDGGNAVYFLPLRRTLSQAGYTNFMELAEERYWEPIEDLCRKIAKYIELDGAIDLQMRYAKGEFYIFECNPRLSGTAHFRHQLGFQDAVWWVQRACGEKVKIDFKLPEKRFVGVRELNEVIYWE